MVGRAGGWKWVTRHYMDTNESKYHPNNIGLDPNSTPAYALVTEHHFPTMSTLVGMEDG